MFQILKRYNLEKDTYRQCFLLRTETEVKKKYYDSCEVFETSTSIRKRKGFGRRGDSGTHTSVNCKESPYF